MQASGSQGKRAAHVTLLKLNARPRAWSRTLGTHYEFQSSALLANVPNHIA